MAGLSQEKKPGEEGLVLSFLGLHRSSPRIRSGSYLIRQAGPGVLVMADEDRASYANVA